MCFCADADVMKTQSQANRWKKAKLPVWPSVNIGPQTLCPEGRWGKPPRRCCSPSWSWRHLACCQPPEWNSPKKTKVETQHETKTTDIISNHKNIKRQIRDSLGGHKASSWWIKLWRVNFKHFSTFYRRINNQRLYKWRFFSFKTCSHTLGTLKE